MSATTTMQGVEAQVTMPKGRSLWSHGWARLKKDRLAIACAIVILVYMLVAILARVGVLAPNWGATVGDNYAPPSLERMDLWFGTDIFGRSVLYKVIHGTRIAMSIGFTVALLSVPIGVFFGAIAGYFGGWIDELVVWFYTTLSSIPNIMLLLAIAYALGKGTSAVYISLIATSWIGLARVIRGEFIKHKGRDYVIAADSLAPRTSRKSSGTSCRTSRTSSS